MGIMDGKASRRSSSRGRGQNVMTEGEEGERTEDEWGGEGEERWWESIW